MPESVIARIAARLPDSALVANLTRHTADLDVWETMVGADHPDLQRERLIVRTLRNEFRRRSGEIV